MGARGNATSNIFTCAKNFGDTDPTPGAHPPNVPILADRRQQTPRTRSVWLLYSSDSRFFWSSCNATSHIFTCAKKNKDPLWLPLIRLLHSWTFLDSGLRGSAARALVCDDTAESIDAVSMGSAATSGASGFLLATAPRLAPATQRRRAPPLGASSRAPPAASAARRGRMVQGLHVHMRAACDKTATTARPTRRAAPSPPAARW